MSDAWPHILVVDDDAEIGALLVRYLSGQGFRVEFENVVKPMASGAL